MEGCNERHARGGASSLTLRPSMKISYVSNRTSCSVDTTLSYGLGLGAAGVPRLDLDL